MTFLLFVTLVLLLKNSELKGVKYVTGMQQNKQWQLEHEKSSGFNSVWTHEVCDSNANAIPLSYD